jgi:hypothetical protein
MWEVSCTQALLQRKRWMTCYSASAAHMNNLIHPRTPAAQALNDMLQRKRWTTCYSASAEKLKTTTAFHHIQILQRKRYTPMSNTEILQPKALEFATRSQTNMISLVRFPERISLFYLCVDLVLISFLSRFYIFLSFFILFDLVCISSHLVLSIVRILYLFRSRDIFLAEKMR